MRPERRPKVVAAALAAAFFSAWAAAQEEKLISGPGAGLTAQKCQICHELAHVTRSRLSRGEWSDNLERMRERGAPLSDAETAIVVNYLATYYGRDPPPPPAPDTLAAGSDDPVAKLLDAHACSGCHATDRRVVGPSFREIGQRYAGDVAAPARLAAKIRSGGAGAWGSVPMPPAAAIGEADLGRLVMWVLGQK